MGIPSATRLAAIFNQAETLAMSLTFKHLCDIYQQKPIMPTANGFEAADVRLKLQPTATNVACWYEPTPIFDERHPQGLQEVVNIMTSDKWNLPIGVQVFAGCLIVMRTPGHALFGRCWEVEGNSTTNDYAPIQIPQRQWCYAKLTTTASIPRFQSYVAGVATQTSYFIVR